MRTHALPLCYTYSIFKTVKHGAVVDHQGIHEHMECRTQAGGISGLRHSTVYHASVFCHQLYVICIMFYEATHLHGY